MTNTHLMEWLRDDDGKNRRRSTLAADVIQAQEEAIMEAVVAFTSIYEAASNGRNDEVLLHAGAISAKLGKLLNSQE